MGCIMSVVLKRPIGNEPLAKTSGLSVDVPREIPLKWSMAHSWANVARKWLFLD